MSCYIAHTVLQLVDSSDPPASACQVTGTLGMATMFGSVIKSLMIHGKINQNKVLPRIYMRHAYQTKY